MENRQEQVKGRRSNGTFAKGHSGNPGGMKLGTKHYSTILDEAIQEDQTTHNGEHILQYYIKQARINDAVLVALIKKLISDKTESEVTHKFSWQDFLAEVNNGEHETTHSGESQRVTG